MKIIRWITRNRRHPPQLHPPRPIHVSKRTNAKSWNHPVVVSLGLNSKCGEHLVKSIRKIEKNTEIERMKRNDTANKLVKYIHKWILNTINKKNGTAWIHWNKQKQILIPKNWTKNKLFTKRKHINGFVKTSFNWIKLMYSYDEIQFGSLLFFFHFFSSILTFLFLLVFFSLNFICHFVCLLCLFILCTWFHFAFSFFLFYRQRLEIPSIILQFFFFHITYSNHILMSPHFKSLFNNKQNNNIFFLKLFNETDWWNDPLKIPTN